ncbi:DUF6463 family protein [Paucibacter soli]|uniref:DUF6463 family protein n=1 Tax=Paucibacter soli TaxID=3133433 RepID=UPI0030AE71D4
MQEQAIALKPRVWMGHWLLGVAALHTAFALVVFAQVYRDVLARGLINTVGRDPMVAAAVWFLLFGFVLALQALAITPLERAGAQRALRVQGWGLLGLALLGVALMPDSGFWLAFPPALLMLCRRGAQ